MNKRRFIPVLASQVVNWGVREPWSLTKKDVKDKIIDKEKFLEFSVDSKNISCPSKICGCVIIKLGESPWGPYSNFKLGQIKNWESILVNVEWFFKAKGTADLVFDLWIIKDKTGVPKEGDMELMVWLDHENLKGFGNLVDNFEGFEVIYADSEFKKDNLPNLRNNPGTISYYSVKPKGRIKFNLLELIKNSAKYFKINHISNYWIRSIDFGVEYTRSTKVRARIFKLDYVFNSAT